jgi:two-component system, cell cycle sensor histidine kinase and response regulator CckA
MSQPSFCASDQTSRPTILLVEDEPFVRDATRRILESAGFSVLPAADALDAIEVYESCHRPIDLVMTDMVLPGRTGRQLGEDLRQRSAQVKVLVTSGYGNAEYETEDPAAHTYFLAKPYSRRSLVEKIKEILGPQACRCAVAQAS